MELHVAWKRWWRFTVSSSTSSVYAPFAPAYGTDHGYTIPCHSQASTAPAPGFAPGFDYKPHTTSSTSSTLQITSSTISISTTHQPPNPRGCYCGRLHHHRYCVLILAFLCPTSHNVDLDLDDNDALRHLDGGFGVYRHTTSRISPGHTPAAALLVGSPWHLQHTATTHPDHCRKATIWLTSARAVMPATAPAHRIRGD